MSAFIEARGISKAFTEGGRVRHVLDNVFLMVERGEFVSILGPMGCGKSTLLSVLAGLTAPDAGTLEIDGAAVRGIRRDAALVFQNYSLLPWFSAIENVRLAVRAAFPRESKSQHQDRAHRAVVMVGLGHAASRRPGQLSGGMRQRVAIARAFATEPAVLFLDEPFSALDALTRETLQQELIRLCSAAGRPVTTVMVTNSIDEAILLSDRIVPMTRGPRARLGAPVRVGLPRPRSAAGLSQADDGVRVKAHIVETLTHDFAAGSARRARAGGDRP